MIIYDNCFRQLAVLQPFFRAIGTQFSLKKALRPFAILIYYKVNIKLLCKPYQRPKWALLCPPYPKVS